MESCLCCVWSKHKTHTLLFSVHCSLNVTALLIYGLHAYGTVTCGFCTPNPECQATPISGCQGGNVDGPGHSLLPAPGIWVLPTPDQTHPLDEEIYYLPRVKWVLLTTDHRYQLLPFQGKVCVLSARVPDLQFGKTQQVELSTIKTKALKLRVVTWLRLSYWHLLS